MDGAGVGILCEKQHRTSTDKVRRNPNYNLHKTWRTSVIWQR